MARQSPQTQTRMPTNLRAKATRGRLPEATGTWGTTQKSSQARNQMILRNREHRNFTTTNKPIDAHKHANPNKKKTEGHSESCRVIAGNWGRLNNQPRERKPSAPARTLQKYSAENHHWQKSAHEQPLKKVKQQYQ